MSGVGGRPSARVSMSRQHSSVSTLTDQTLIAFEIEHERNRLKEELHRLNSAQDDVSRSLELLSFMSAGFASDPLANPACAEMKQAEQALSIHKPSFAQHIELDGEKIAVSP